MTDNDDVQSGEIKFANETHDNASNRDILNNVLPQPFNYLVQSFTLLKESDVIGEQGFKITLKVNIDNKKETKERIKKFQTKSTTGYNQTHEDRNINGPTVLFSGKTNNKTRKTWYKLHRLV